MEWGNIAIACRVGSCPDAEFFRCWTRFIASGLRPGDFILEPAIEMPHHYAANMLANKFLNNTQCDTVLFVDDDMCFNPDTLDKMRDDKGGQEYDGLMGLCLARTNEHRPLIVKETYTSNGQLLYNYPSEWPASGIEEVAFLGLGFTLYRRSVFEKVKPENNEFFRWTSRSGEDAQFAIDARAKGCKLGVNCNVKIGHRVKQVLYPEVVHNVGYSTNWKVR